VYCGMDLFMQKYSLCYVINVYNFAKDLYLLFCIYEAKLCTEIIYVVLPYIKMLRNYTIVLFHHTIMSTEQVINVRFKFCIHRKLINLGKMYSAFFLTVAIGNCMVKRIPPVNFCSDENIQTIFGTKLEDFLIYRIDYNSIS
jgi:hypothetical protein